MHEALRPRDDIDRLYVSRKEGAGGLASIENSIDASKWGVEDVIKKNKEIRQFWLFNHKKKNSQFKPIKLRFKKWLCVAFVCAEELGNYILYVDEYLLKEVGKCGNI